MKRADLIKAIASWANANDLEVQWRQGGRHTVVRLGSRGSSIPRHSEINEITARKILKDLGIKEKR
ncbi:MAG: hypothetical protein LKI24_10445 [Acidipropionibacterium sp.]|jgi:mRNA interferase HicA|nr:hypothetical protein [Acidipropionibacterium sp.]